jgi:hypothetical protein
MSHAQVYNTTSIPQSPNSYDKFRFVGTEAHYASSYHGAAVGDLVLFGY